jgi:hypothetical protein
MRGGVIFLLLGLTAVGAYSVGRQSAPVSNAGVRRRTAASAAVMTAIRFVALTLFGLVALGQQAHASRCEEFVARFIEGATQYKLPAPQFELEHVNEADADVTYWKITMFSDVRAMMSCWHGWVKTFAADANNSEGMSSLHLSTLMGIGLYSYVLDWREAIALRDDLMREAKGKDDLNDLQTAKRTIDDTIEASLVISFAGVPSFMIEPLR